MTRVSFSRLTNRSARSGGSAITPARRCSGATRRPGRHCASPIRRSRSSSRRSPFNEMPQRNPMKKQIILTTALAALFPLAAFAQSPNSTASVPPVPAVPPVQAVAPVPPLPPPRGHAHERDMGPKEPVTFLGVETSEVPRVLSEQMGLPRGFGVVVDYVVPNGPAAAAGLQPSDIIRMLNDQQIVDPSQLGKLVRSFGEGTSVDLTLLRKGKEVK